MVLYRKYRPQKFADLVGQKHIKDSLLSALTSGKISHGYLFSGPKGTGKTSTARIFAKAVNCKVYSPQSTDYSRKKSSSSSSSQKSVDGRQIFGEPCNKCTSCQTITDGSHLDLIEIDAASNRGIDEIRDLREKIKLSPVSGRFKIYIIDEAHMLTTEAFNALLKTLEEPPKHVIFILCTTNPAKLPATILSRLSRFNFQYASNSEIIGSLSKVANAEKVKIDDGALGEIARASDGSFRDALSILDQLASSGKKIAKDDVKALMFAPHGALVYEFILALSAKDLKKTLILVEEGVAHDVDFSNFCQMIVLFFEKALLFKFGAQDVVSDRLESVESEQIQSVAQAIAFSDLQELMKLFLLAEGEIEDYPLPHIPIILAACKYCGDVAQEVVTDESTELKNESPEVESASKHPRAERSVGKTKGKIKSISQIETLWGDFLSRVKPVNAHLVAILRATKPTAFNGERLTLTAFYRFHKDKLEEPKISLMVSKILDEVLGQKVSLKINLAEKWDRPPRAVRESDLVEASGDDLASMASEIFSK